MTASIDDYRWLVEEGEPWLQRASQWHHEQTPLLRQIQRLRKDLPPLRAKLVVDQIELRERARNKFQAAERMFFTRRSLEQSTDAVIANYKAGRCNGSKVADLCCGIGGDLYSLAERTSVVGIDRDPVVCALARANCDVLSLSNAAIACSDVDRVSLADFDSWHLDPDRRLDAGQRVTSVENCTPSAPWIAELRRRSPHGVIKLAPAVNADHSCLEGASLEWIGHRRECQQLVAWCGDIASEEGVDRSTRKATVLDATGVGTSFSVDDDAVAGVAETIADHLYEPHAVILAAGLESALAVENGWSRVAPAIAYFTCEARRTSPLWSCFEVIDVMAFRVKSLQQLLARHHVGRLEIKKRCVDIAPETLRRKLKLAGDNDAAVFLYPLKQTINAVLARRIE